MKNVLKFSEYLACIQLISIKNSFECNMPVDWFNVHFLIRSRVKAAKKFCIKMHKKRPSKKFIRTFLTNLHIAMSF